MKYVNKNLINKALVVSLCAALVACNGDDGTNGVNGLDGSDGSNGLNSLVMQINLAVGDTNCPNGGVQIDSGLDDNANDTLETAEIDATSFNCVPGVSSLASTEVISSLNNTWFKAGVEVVDKAEEMSANANIEQGKAKNVILFVGDGMGVSTITAARILEGQMQGLQGEEHSLSFESFPFSGLVKTYNVDAQTPDSAGTMTAMMTGVKTDVGVINVDEDIVRGDCSTVAGNELVTALELAELAGLSTGVISTARITHATPAATYAKSADRNWEDVSDMPAEALTQGCKDIAEQLVNFEANLEARFAGSDVNGLEVAMGGGRRHFLPKDVAFNSPDARSAVEGDRTDGRDLTAEWQAMYPAGNYVFDRAGFDAINPEVTTNLFGLFNESHMQYEADRANDISGEPSIADMTDKAIKVLDNNDKGYFLMVESGRIDHGHHAGSAYNGLTDTIAFAEAIKQAYEQTDPAETLILVTADHGHVFTIAGYPKRGNPILGKVISVGNTDPSLASDGLPYTTLGYTNGRGFRDLGDETNADATYAIDNNNSRVDISLIDTQSSGYHQEALVPLSSETHSGEDISVHASGPSAKLLTSTLEQNYLFHVMNHAANLTGKAEEALP